MTALIIFLGYFAGAVLTARHCVWRTMLINERSEFAGQPLEAKLYSKSDLVRIANNSRADGFRYRNFDSSNVPLSDHSRVVMAGLFWWAYLVGGTIKVLVMSGHKKTPGQREAELKAREEAAEANEARIAELQKKNDDELARKLREAGIEDV